MICTIKLPVLISGTKGETEMTVLGNTGSNLQRVALFDGYDGQAAARSLTRQEIRRLIIATTAKMMPDARAIDAPEGRLP